MNADNAPPTSAFSIMLVDDHEVVRSGYRRFIDSGVDLHVCDEAASASEAYSLLIERQATDALPDLLVVDISLSDRSGLELIDRCRRRFGPLRILVFSMHEEPRIVEHALQAGAQGYVSKSSTPSVVIEAIHALREGRTFIDPALAQRLAELGQRTDPLATLSRREYEIVRQWVTGRDTLAISQSLCVSPKTVSNHLSAIRAKLKVGNDIQLMKLVESSHRVN